MSNWAKQKRHEEAQLRYAMRCYKLYATDRMVVSAPRRPNGNCGCKCHRMAAMYHMRKCC